MDNSDSDHSPALRKEGRNVLFNDALNTFYLPRQTYGKQQLR